MNSFGEILRLTTFGESHGPAIGGILDGIPSGFEIDREQIQLMMDLRRPGGSALGSRRKESDTVQILSGVFEGKTLGTPIGFIIANSDAKGNDYLQLKDIYRPNHADYTYDVKYGLRDYRGGGRASARETACRVCAGAIAMQILSNFGIHFCAYTSRIGEIVYSPSSSSVISFDNVFASEVRCPDLEIASKMSQLIRETQSRGDTVGGEASCEIYGLPAGLGEPVFDKFQSRLAAAMMSIPAAKGFEYGMGFEVAKAFGSQCIDSFVSTTSANFSGGIQGGITTGRTINFRVAFKPAPTLMQPVETIDKNYNRVTLKMKGRHDACVVPRAVPVVMAMSALVTLDAILLNRATRLRDEL